MEDFINAYNNSKSPLGDPGTVLEKPFVGDPRRLPKPVVEELLYKFQYLQETIEDLAFFYRVTPRALEQYLETYEVAPEPLDTPEQLAKFESDNNARYKNIRVRLSGLVALHTAQTWSQLAESENNLLASLKNATLHLSTQQYPDAKTISALTTAHNKIVDRHQLIKNAIDVPADRDVKNLIDTITKSLEDVLDRIDSEAPRLPSEENNELGE